jgi:hypothetical protein
MMAQGAGEANDTVGDRPCCFGEVVSDIFANPLRVLVASAAKPSELAGIDQPLQIDQGDAGGFEVARAIPLALARVSARSR